MKKEFYVTPSTEALVLSLESTVLQPSNFGDPGQPGQDLNILDPLVF